MPDEFDLPLDPVEPEDITIESSMRENVIIPANYYEAEIVACGAMPNPFYEAYEKQCEEEGMEPNVLRKKQVQIDFKVTHDGHDINLRHWVSPIVSKNPKTGKVSNLYMLLDALGMDPKVGFKTSDLVGKCIKVNVTVGKKDDGTQYNKIPGGGYAPLT